MAEERLGAGFGSEGMIGEVFGMIGEEGIWKKRCVGLGDTPLSMGGNFPDGKIRGFR